MPEIKHEYSGDNIFAKLRYNTTHNNTDWRWKLFVLNGIEEKLHLCKHVNFYKAGQTFVEMIDGVKHFSIIFETNRIIIDGADVGWIM